MGTLGLRRAFYKRTKDFQHTVRCLLSLPLLDPRYVDDIFQLILDRRPYIPSINRLFVYVLDTYIAEDALFPSKMWNLYDKLVKKQLLSTGILESWHYHGLREVFKMENRSIYSLIRHLQNEYKTSMSMIRDFGDQTDLKPVSAPLHWKKYLCKMRVLNASIDDLTGDQFMARLEKISKIGYKTDHRIVEDVSRVVEQLAEELVSFKNSNNAGNQ